MFNNTFLAKNLPNGCIRWDGTKHYNSEGIGYLYVIDGGAPCDSHFDFDGRSEAFNNTCVPLCQHTVITVNGSTPHNSTDVNTTQPGNTSAPIITQCNSSTCNGNGACENDGTCMCNENWNGAACDVCAIAFYGLNCSTFCHAGTCNSHGACNDENGTCDCEPHYDGDLCEFCELGWYTTDCNIQCNITDTCNGHGVCDSDNGECICNTAFNGSGCTDCANVNSNITNNCTTCVDGWYGSSCDVQCNASICNENGVCEPDGTCTCDYAWNGTECDVCASSYYDLNCSTFCNETTCNNRGVCNDADGTCDCGPHYAGDSCETCTTGWHTADCSVQCNATETCTNRGVCNDADGTCDCGSHYDGDSCEMCKPGWYTADCSVYCNTTETCNSHGLCSDVGICICDHAWNGTECDVCKTGWYTTDCSVQCNTTETCNNRGVCSDADGTCDCSPHYAGVSCNDCNPGWYTTDCSVYCNATETCNSHGSCNAALNEYISGTWTASYSDAVQVSLTSENTFPSWLYKGNGNTWSPYYFSQLDGNLITITDGVNMETRTLKDYPGGLQWVSGSTASDGTMIVYLHWSPVNMLTHEYTAATSTVTVTPQPCVCTSHYAGDSCETCKPEWYTADCSVYCNATETCNSHGLCSDVGICICDHAWNGTECDVCKTGWYTADCSVQCNVTETCNNHGACSDADGTCDCDPHYAGHSCEMCKPEWYTTDCNVQCNTTDTCNNHGVCDSENGECICNTAFNGSGCTDCVNANSNITNNCTTCVDQYYGVECDVFCEASTSCLGHGVCDINGSCLCEPKWNGTKCEMCKMGWYTTDCSVYCNATETCTNRGVCNDAGTCDCGPHYAGDSCETCKPGWYTTDCSVYCNATETCNSHGVCSNVDGTCDCTATFTGSGCMECSVNIVGCPSSMTHEEVCTPTCNAGETPNIFTCGNGSIPATGCTACQSITSDGHYYTTIGMCTTAPCSNAGSDEYYTNTVPSTSNNCSTSNCTSATECNAVNKYRDGCGNGSVGTCTPCSSCGTVDGENTYRSSCGGLSAGTCAPCGTCEDGDYWSLPCGGESAGTCSACVACSTNEYTIGCGGENAGTCTTCATCTEGNYYREGCVGNSAGNCTSCGTCSPGMFVSGCDNSTFLPETCELGCDGNCGFNWYGQNAGTPLYNEHCGCCGGTVAQQDVCKITCPTAPVGSPGTCTPCDASACTYDEYLNGCSGNSAGICTQCVCGDGNYWSLPCGVPRESPGTCTSCNASACADDEYLDGCSGNNAGICTPCVCGDGNYWSLPCGGANAGQCEPCGTCPWRNASNYYGCLDDITEGHCGRYRCREGFKPIYCGPDGGGCYCVIDETTRTQYASSACTETENTVCGSCGTCGVGEYVNTTCSATAPTECASCETCEDGNHWSSPCGGDSSGTCTTCLPCGTENISSPSCVPPSSDNDYGCKPLHFHPAFNGCYLHGSHLGLGGTRCEEGYVMTAFPNDDPHPMFGYCECPILTVPTYRSSPCGGLSAGTCTSCAACGDGTHWSIPCRSNASACADGTYLTGCSGENAGICTACSSCGTAEGEANTFWSSPCGGLSAGTCSQCTTCENDYYQSLACEGESAGECTPCTTCGNGSYWSAVCAGEYNGTCTECTPCGDDEVRTSACEGDSAGTCGLAPIVPYCAPPAPDNNYGCDVNGSYANGYCRNGCNPPYIRNWHSAGGYYCSCPVNSATNGNMINITSACTSTTPYTSSPSSPLCEPRSKHNDWGCQWWQEVGDCLAENTNGSPLKYPLHCKHGYIQYDCYMFMPGVVSTTGWKTCKCKCPPPELIPPPPEKECTAATTVSTCEGGKCMVDGVAHYSGYTTHHTFICECVATTCEIKYANIREGGSNVEVYELAAEGLQLQYFLNFLANSHCTEGPCLTFGNLDSSPDFTGSHTGPIPGDMVYIYKGGALWSNSSIEFTDNKPLPNTIVLAVPFMNRTTGVDLVLPSDLSDITVTITSPLGCAGNPTQYSKCNPTYGIRYLWGTDWGGVECIEACEKFVKPIGTVAGYCSPMAADGDARTDSVTITGSAWDAALGIEVLNITAYWHAEQRCYVNMQAIDSSDAVGLKSVLQTLWTKGKDHPNATEVTIDNVTGNYVQWWEDAFSTCNGALSQGACNAATFFTAAKLLPCASPAPDNNVGCKAPLNTNPNAGRYYGLCAVAVPSIPNSGCKEGYVMTGIFVFSWKEFGYCACPTVSPLAYPDHACVWAPTHHANCSNVPTCCNVCGGRSVARLESEGFHAATCERLQTPCDTPFATGEGHSEWPRWCTNVTFTTPITEGNCLEKAEQEFGNRVTATENFLHLVNTELIPFGCTVHSNGDWAAYWNSYTCYGTWCPTSYDDYTIVKDVVVTEEQCP